MLEVTEPVWQLYASRLVHELADTTSWVIKGHLIQIGLMLVGAFYAFITFRMFLQNRKNVEALQEQVALQKKQHANSIAPYFEIVNIPKVVTASNGFYLDIEYENLTQNLAFHPILIHRWDDFCSKAHGFSATVTHAPVKGLASINLRTTSVSEIEVESRLKPYSTELFIYINEPYLGPCTSKLAHLILLVYMDVAGNLYLRQSLAEMDASGNFTKRNISKIMSPVSREELAVWRVGNAFN